MLTRFRSIVSVLACRFRQSPSVRAPNNPPYAPVQRGVRGTFLRVWPREAANGGVSGGAAARVAMADRRLFLRNYPERIAERIAGDPKIDELEMRNFRESSWLIRVCRFGCTSFDNMTGTLGEQPACSGPVRFALRPARIHQPSLETFCLLC
jgi:hypothetical protein